MKETPSIIDILLTHWSVPTLIQTAKMSSHPLESLQFRQFSASLDPGKASREITAVILTVDPNHLFERCMDSVRNQSIRPCAVEVVRNVSPVSKARQEGLEKVLTPFYVNVDGDMDLGPTCFERLFFTMTRSSRCGEAEASLVDPLLGIIKGVKMYRTEPVRTIGFHPLTDDKTEDRFMSRKLAEQGFVVRDTHTVEGAHHPVYQPLEAFWRFRFMSEKLRYYNYPLEGFLDYYRTLSRGWKRTGDTIFLYALAGLFDGIQAENIEGDLNYEERATHEAFRKFDAFIRSTSPR